MNQNSTIIAQNDNLVSRIVKARDPFCMIRLEGCQGRTVDPAHVFGRTNMGTRFQLSAVFGACRYCHSYIDTHPEEKELIFVEIMGISSYEDMALRANRNTKFMPSDLRDIRNNLKKRL